MKRNRKLISLVTLLLVILTGALLFTGCDSEEQKAAKEKFATEADRIETEKSDLDDSIEKATELLNNHGKPLFRETVTDLQKTVAKAEKYEVNIPDVPDSVKDIEKATKKISKLGYADMNNEVKSKTKDLKDSVKQNKQMTNPSEDFILERVRSVEGVEEALPVTESNDPNEMLNKQGGYTACIYFAYDKVDDEWLEGDIIADGTDGGGAIEVYKTKAQAKTRNDYLAGFDGMGMLASGSHSVVGTVVVRTSIELPASQQQELEQKLIDALIELR